MSGWDDFVSGFDDGDAGFEFENKSSFANKSEHGEEHSPAQAKTFLGFVKGFSEFAKGIYETCNFFNFALIIAVVAFSIVRLILFLHITGNN